MHQEDVVDSVVEEDEGVVVVVEDLEVEVEVEDLVIEVVEVDEGEEFVAAAFSEAAVVAEDSEVDVVVIVVEGVEGEEEDGVQEGEAGEEEEVDPTPSSNPTDTPEYSSQKAKITCWSPRTSYQASRYMARSGYLSRVEWKERKSNTGCGILSEASWLLVCLEVLMISISNLARRCFTSVLPVVPVSVMSLI